MNKTRKLFSSLRGNSKQGTNSEPSKTDNIKATIYGNCIGDAIGLLSEFMTKVTAEEKYGKKRGKLEYKLKVNDRHRLRWEIGDWTDDSDQMILIMKLLIETNGKIDVVNYASKLRTWMKEGFAELGDSGGMGIGQTTCRVLTHEIFQTDPHGAARKVWELTGKNVAPNGGVMRTSVLGAYMYNDIDKVIENTLQICKITHADPRCLASCVAVTTAVAQMIQKKHMTEDGQHHLVDVIMEESFNYAKKYLENEEHITDLRDHMFAENISDLKLDDMTKIGYTYKCMGSGFWALRQDDFRKALESVVFEGGDADTNGAVAGALLGCKLGLKGLPRSWLKGLKHKAWLDNIIDEFLTLVEQKLEDQDSISDEHTAADAAAEDTVSDNSGGHDKTENVDKQQADDIVSDNSDGHDKKQNVDKQQATQT